MTSLEPSAPVEKGASGCEVGVEREAVEACKCRGEYTPTFECVREGVG